MVRSFFWGFSASVLLYLCFDFLETPYETPVEIPSASFGMQCVNTGSESIYPPIHHVRHHYALIPA